MVENIYYYYCVIMILESGGRLVKNQQHQTKPVRRRQNNCSNLPNLFFHKLFTSNESPSNDHHKAVTDEWICQLLFNIYWKVTELLKVAATLLLTDAIHLVGGVADEEWRGAGWVVGLCWLWRLKRCQPCHRRLLRCLLRSCATPFCEENSHNDVNWLDFQLSMLHVE